MQVIFRKTTTSKRTLLRKMTYEDKASLYSHVYVNIAVCCSVLQWFAVSCSVCQGTVKGAGSGLIVWQTIRHTATYCCTLQPLPVGCSVAQCAAVCCSVLQCAAVCCSVLQCAAVCCSALLCDCNHRSLLQNIVSFIGLFCRR